MWFTQNTKPKSKTKKMLKKQSVKKSYGVAVCRFDVSSKCYEVLMIKKRYTYHYVEFVLGHYRRSDDEKLRHLFSNMSHEEKVTILSLDFGKIWYKIWLIDPESCYGVQHKKLNPEELLRYNNCKKHFEKCFVQDNGEKLRQLINNSKCVDTIWEIPKGRRSATETALDCALRETAEETGLHPEDYTLLLDIEPVMMASTDLGVQYESYYYIALINTPVQTDKVFKIDPLLDEEYWRIRKYSSQNVKLDFKNKHQVAEVVALRWTNSEFMRIIAPLYYNTTKKIIRLLLQKQIGGFVLCSK